MRQTMVFFGDSICAGYRAAQGQGWVERLAQDMQNTQNMPDMLVVNSGVSGETTNDALRRFDSAVAAHKPSAVYVQFGLNDASWWCRQVGRSWLSEEQYISNMADMVARMAQCGAKHIFVATNHPVRQSTPEVEGQPSYPAVVRQYNEALRRQFAPSGGNENVFLIDMERAMQGSGENIDTFLDPDGLHLSLAGNVFYAKSVASILRKHMEN